MTPIPAHLWDDSEIPAVSAPALQAGLSFWLARERQGLTLVGSGQPSTQTSIDKTIVKHFEHPSIGLAVLRRVQALAMALASRRFRHLTRIEHRGDLDALVAHASGMRLNARFGFSTNKLAWALAGTDKATEVREAA